MKKRSKKRTWRPIARNPLIPRDAQSQELPGLIGLSMLGTEALNEHHIYDLVANADIAKRLPNPPSDVIAAAKAIKETCLTVLARDKIGVSGDDMKQLKTNLPITLKYLGAQHPATIWKAAMASVKEFETKGGLKL